MDTETDRLDTFEAEIERLVQAEIDALRSIPLGTPHRRRAARRG